MLCCTEKHSYLKNKQKSKTAVALCSCSVCQQLLCLCSFGWMNFLFCSIYLINTSANTFVSLFSKHLSDTRPVSMALSYCNHNRAFRGVLFLKAACPTGLCILSLERISCSCHSSCRIPSSSSLLLVGLWTASRSLSFPFSIDIFPTARCRRGFLFPSTSLYSSIVDLVDGSHKQIVSDKNSHVWPELCFCKPVVTVREHSDCPPFGHLK